MKFKKLFEQLPEWATAPTPVKGGNGPRDIEAEIDTPVVHVAGSWNDAPRLTSKPKVKTKKPIAPSLPLELSPPRPTYALSDIRLDAPDAFTRCIAWAIEREAIRKRGMSGQSPPWTTDPILAQGRFCNIYRELDATTRWVTENIVAPHRDDPDLWFALLMARCCSNEPKALARLVRYLLPFDADRFRAELDAMIAADEKVYRTDAYKPIMPPKALKGIRQPKFHTEHVLKPAWRDRESYRPRAGETLAGYSIRLQGIQGVGDFLAAQIIADLKHVEPLRSAADWWTFAEPGPGSRRGLNRVLEKPLDGKLSKPLWLGELLKLRDESAPYFEAAGMLPVDAQNMQNVCCEFHKYERAREDNGKPSRRYAPAGQPAAKKTRAKQQVVIEKPSVELPAAEPPAAAPAEPITKYEPVRRPPLTDVIDRDEALRFLRLLDPTTEQFTFQTFDDNHDRKDPKLAKVLHGTLDQHFNRLSFLNARRDRQPRPYAQRPATPTPGAAARQQAVRRLR